MMTPSIPTTLEPVVPPLLLSELPEDALCRVLSALQSPRDVCRAGACCRALLTGSRSDSVWECLCCRAFPLYALRKVHTQCFRGRNVADPFSVDPPQALRTTLQCWRADASDSGVPTADWLRIFRSLAYWPFPAKVVRFGADTTSLLYLFECPTEAADGGHPHAGGIYNLFARTAGQTNHVHQGRWSWVDSPKTAMRAWRLSPAGSTGGKRAVLSEDYTRLTISSGGEGSVASAGRGTGGCGVVPFHSNIPPLWREVVEKDSLVLELGHSKRV